jgi:hypothetical protein
MARCRNCGIVLIKLTATLGRSDLPPEEAPDAVAKRPAPRLQADSGHGPAAAPSPGDSPAMKTGLRFQIPSAKRIPWQSLVPDVLYGLATGRQAAAIAGSLLAVVCVVLGFVWWSPFSGGGDSVVPRGSVESLAFSDDGQQLTAGRGHGLIEVWDPQSQRLAETLEFVNAKYIGRDSTGRFLLAGDANGCALYDVTTRQRVVEEKGIKSLTTNRGQTRAATESVDGRVIVWNFESGQIDAAFELDGPTASACAVSTDGSRCAIGTSDGTALLLDMDKQELIQEYALPDPASIGGIDISDDGGTLALGTASGQIYLWPVNSPKATTLLEGEAGPIEAITFLSDNELLALRHRHLDRWDIEAATVSRTEVPLERANSMAVDAEQERAAVGSTEEPEIIVLDLGSGEQLAHLDLPLE